MVVVEQEENIISGRAFGNREGAAPERSSPCVPVPMFGSRHE
jgi:hypothetical protein